MNIALMAACLSNTRYKYSGAYRPPGRDNRCEYRLPPPTTYAAYMRDRDAHAKMMESLLGMPRGFEK